MLQGLEAPAVFSCFWASSSSKRTALTRALAASTASEASQMSQELPDSHLAQQT